jgi:hypothetical protein
VRNRPETSVLAFSRGRLATNLPLLPRAPPAADYIGTLMKFIEAMNGELVLAAQFTDGVEVPIQIQLAGIE